MNEKRIRKIRIRFLLISFVSLMLAMLIVTGLILGSNQWLTRRNIRNVLQYIVDNKGDLPGAKDLKKNRDVSASHNHSVIRFMNEIFNPETMMDDVEDPEFSYNNRYFAIIYDKDRNIQNVITNHTAVVTKQEAEVYGNWALEKGPGFGRYYDYYFQVADLEDDGKIVVYLDSSDIIDINARLLYVTIGMIFLGMIFAAVFTLFFSKWAITSEICNMEAQKGFITNASHELKTPLTVIRANTEMIEMLDGESEWTKSILRQAERLTGLIQNLVTIARAEEYESDAISDDCDITLAVLETVKIFEPVAKNEGKKITQNLTENVRMRAMDSQIRQLTSLLVDNAIKYCDDNGTICVVLNRKGRSTSLEVSNDYLEGEGQDYSRFFERFYRADESHNPEKGGYGIGLSIAESIVKVYKGSIDVSWKNGRISFICILRG